MTAVRAAAVDRGRSPLRAAMERPAFRRLFVAQTVSRWGDTFNAVAVVLLLYRLTGSGLRVGLGVAFEVVPVLALGLVAGSVVDRMPRRTVMIAADLGRAAIAAGLILGQDHLWAVYAAAFGLASLSVFFNPAAASVLPAVVPERELVGANSALWSSAVISQIGLAPAAGWLVVVAGPGWAFALNAASFCVSAALLARLPGPQSPPGAATGRGQLTGGLAAVRANRFLTTLATVQAMAALSAGATSALLVLYAQQHLGVGGGRFGVLLAAIGIGAAIGPLVLQRYVPEVRRGAFVFGPFVLRGGVDLTLAATRSYPVALGALGVYGLGTSTGNVAYTTVLQTGVPDMVRGRVFALFDLIWSTGRLTSIAAGGVLADAVGVRAVYLLGGLLLAAAGVFGLAAAGSAPRQPRPGA